MKQDLTKFNEVDQQQAQQEHLLAFLDFANQEPVALAWRRQMLGLLNLKAGEAVLDAGCGEGFDTRMIFPLVQPGGRVVGADISEFFLETGRKRAAAQGMAIEYQKADVMNLPFADATFDAARVERLLMHVPDPAKAIAELTRVVKPGGRLVAFDWDWDTFSIDADDPQFVRTATRLLSDGFKSGLIGRQLRATFQRAGLLDVQTVPGAQPFPWELMRQLLSTLDRFVEQGLLSGEGLQAFWVDQEARMKSGCFSVAAMSFIAYGRKAPSQ